MSLRKKTTIVTGITIILLIIIMYGIHTLLIKRSFLELEREDALHKLSHISALIQNEKMKLESVTGYVLLEGIKGKETVENIFSSFNIDVLLFTNGKTVLYQKNKNDKIFYSIIQDEDSSLITISHPVDYTLFIDDVPYLISTTSGIDTNKNITVTAGIKIDSAFIHKIKDDENVIVNLLFNEESEQKSGLLKDENIFLLTKENELSGYILFSGSVNEPKGIVEVILPRTIYEQGESIFRFTILLIILIGIFVYIVIMLFFEITVLSNVKNLGNQVNYIAETEDDTAQIEMKVRDEIGLLAQKINRMIRIKRVADKALRESEHFHKVIFESSDDAFVIVDEKNKAIYTNPKFHKLLGFTAEELSGKDYYNLIFYGKDKQSNKYSFPFESRLKRKDGTMVDVEIAKSSIIIKNSPCTLERYTDLTEKKKSEIKIRESHERFLSIFQSAEDIIFTVDKSGIISSINNYGVTFSGKKLSEIEGKHIEDIFGLTNEHNLLKMIKEVISTGNKRVDEIIIKEKIYLNAAVTRMLDNSSGEPVALIIGRDITGIKALEEETRKNQLQIQQADKLASLGLLVAGVAHEINNPVSFISFNVPYIEQYFNEIFPLLDDYAAKNPGYKIANVEYELFKKDIKDMLSDLYEGAQRITSIVTDLKTFSKMETENEETFVKLDEIIHSTIRLLQPAVKKKNAAISYKCDKEYRVKGNRQKIGQVIINLLTNSLDAVEEGKGEIIIAAGLIVSEKSLNLSVTDNGSGISEKDRHKIFDPFFTTKSSGSGTGLGLSVAKSIVESMGFALGFKSEKNNGTTFFITIPEEYFK